MNTSANETITVRGQSQWVDWLRTIARDTGLGVPRLIAMSVGEFAKARSLPGSPPRLPDRVRQGRSRASSLIVDGRKCGR
jgi:hypothetical protein